MANSIVKYGAYTPEAAEEDAKASVRLGAFLKLTPGQHKLRFLPPPVGKRSPFKKVNQHFFEVNGEKVVFVCPRYEIKKPCPGCQQVAELSATGNTADRELAKQYRAQERYFANVIDRAAPEKGVQVFQVPWNVHQVLIALAKDVDAGGDFTHPESGFDILITRTGTGKNDTRYTVFPAKKSSPLLPNAEEMNALIEGQPDLDALSRIQSYEEIAAALGLDTSAPAKDVSGSKEPEVQRGSKPQSKRRSAQDDIEDAETEDVDF